MIVLTTTAFSIITGEGFSIFHVLSFNGLTATCIGFGAVLLRRHVRRWYYWHYHGMYWSFTGLMGATANEIIVNVPWILAWVQFHGTMWPILVVQTLILIVACVLIFRNQDPTLRQMGFIS